MSNFTQRQIFNRYQNGEVDKATIINYFRDTIENENSDDLRFKALEYLGLTEIVNNEIFKFLENLLISDSNEKIRGKSAQLIIQNYLNKAEKILKWVLNNERSIKCLLEIYTSLSNLKKEISESLFRLMEITLGKVFIDKYGIVPEESMFLGLLQLAHRYVTFFGDNDGWGGGEFYIHFKSEQGYVREMHCRNVIPNFRIVKYFSYLKILKITDLESNRPDFRGLGELKNLEHLELNYLEFKSIEDLREIKGLINLQELYITNSSINEIKYLDKLVNLKKLSLIGGEDVGWNGELSELKGLNNLVNLKSLALSYNKISEIKGLDKLVNLERLSLDNNQIMEVKGLDSLSSLKELYLSYNQIDEIKGLNKLSQLEVLGLSDNQISEIKNLDNLRNLKALGLSNNSFKIEDAYSQFKRGFFKDYIFKRYLISIIVSQDKDEMRQEALNYLEELSPTEPYICGYLTNLISFHKESEALKISIARILINNYLKDSIENLKNAVKRSKSQDFITIIHNILIPINSFESKSLIEFIRIKNKNMKKIV